MRASGAGAVGTKVGQIAKIGGCRAIGIGGGDILDAALTRLAMHAHVVICGANPQFNSTSGIRDPANYLWLLVSRASMTGTLVFDCADRYAEATRELGAWRAAGQLKSREDVLSGIDRFPDALFTLLRSENMGKLVLAVADR